MRLKTDSAFQRYILVTEDEMGGMKWLDQKKNSGTIDTYMDTNEHSIIDILVGQQGLEPRTGRL